MLGPGGKDLRIAIIRLQLYDGFSSWWVGETGIDYYETGKSDFIKNRDYYRLI